MKYTIRSGSLYRSGEEAPRLRICGLLSEEKRIEDAGGRLQLQVRVCRDRRGQGGDVRFHRYVMTDPQGGEVASASPGYADGEAPEEAGWPVNRMPRADRADVRLLGRAYSLRMKPSDSFVLTDEDGGEAACLTHRGLAGGWNMTAQDALAPEVVCGLYVFCRYLERENELLMV